MCWILGIRLGGLRACWERGVWIEDVGREEVACEGSGVTMYMLL